MENKVLKCRYITPTEWEQINNSERDFFNNNVKIMSDGQATFCCSEIIIESIARRINDGTLTFSSKKLRNDGKMIEHIFIDKQNNITTKISIPSRLVRNKYSFIENDVKQLDKLCSITQRIRYLKVTKEILKRTGAAVLSAATLAASYAGTKKLIDSASNNVSTESNPIYNRYYENIMSEEEFNKNLENLRKTYEETQKKYNKK